MKYLKYAVTLISLLTIVLYAPENSSDKHKKGEFGAAGFSIKWLLPANVDPLLKNAVCRETTLSDFKVTLQKAWDIQQIYLYSGKTSNSHISPTACSISEIGIWGISTEQHDKVSIKVFSREGVLLFTGKGSIKSVKAGQLKNSGTINLSFSEHDKVSPTNLTGRGVINDGNKKTSKRLININISASDNIGVTGYLLSERKVPTGTDKKAWHSISPSMVFKKRVPFLLSKGEGQKTVSVWFKDGAGNISKRNSDSITLDISDQIPPVNRTNPDFPDYDPLIKSKGKILLKLAATDNKAVTGYFISTSPEPPEPENSGWHMLTFPTPDFSNFVNFEVTKISKAQSIFIWFIDKAGNISNRVTGVVRKREVKHAPKESIDNTPPENLTKKSFINRGRKETFLNTLTLEISASDSESGVAGYWLSEFNETPAPGVQGWVSIKPVKHFSGMVNLPAKGAPGEKSVYVWFKDLSGNVSKSMSSSIVLKYADPTPPANTTSDDFINSGNRVTSSSTVFLSISASDKEGNLYGYFISESPEVPTAKDNVWHQVLKTGSYTSRVPFKLSPGNEKKSVYVWFRDLQGNISNVKSDSVQKKVFKKLPDTGQHQMFTGTFFFGEDADYTVSPMAFVDYRDGTVKDTVTDLIWQNSIGSSPKTWVEAVNYCDSLIFGKKSLNNWRLPAVSELFSIIDYGETSPTINSQYFPGTKQDFYWTSTQYAAFPQMAWYVDFNFGTSGYYRFKTNRYYVRCVHDSEPVNMENAADNVNISNEVATEAETGLIWQRGEAGSMLWEEAIIYCESLKIEGDSKWRVPNVKELRSLINDGTTKPAVDLRKYPKVHFSDYWTSTTYVSSAYSYCVNFTTGVVGYCNKSQKKYVRCVKNIL